MAWQCHLCTFQNRHDHPSKCEICETPRSLGSSPAVGDKTTMGIERPRSKASVQMNLFGGIVKSCETKRAPKPTRTRTRTIDQPKQDNDKTRSIYELGNADDSNHSNLAAKPLENKAAAQNYPFIHRLTISAKTTSLSFSELKVPGKKILTEIFGIKKLRSLQPVAVTCALKRQSQIVVMATGAGKSLCYQLPAVILGGTTIVISPLIALMKDQVQALMEKGVQAAAISSNNKEKINKDIMERLLTKNKSLGNLKPVVLLYVTPEQVQTNRFRDVLKELNAENKLTMFVVDEAHCLSAWGHDFRKSYMQLDYLRLTYPSVPLMACTATATPAVLQDIKKVLHLEKSACHVGSFDRPNIFYRVRYKDSLEALCPGGAMKDLISFIKKQHTMALKDNSPCAGIIYVHKREETTEIANTVRNQCGISTAAYHAGLPVDERNKAQEDWTSGEVNVVVATVAFGMGIDLGCVRYVIHWTMPKNVEAFYQESGRAGRDGLPSFSMLYYSRDDASKFQFLLNNKKSKGEKVEPSERDIAALDGIIKYCTIPGCRRHRLLKHFGENIEDMSQLCKKTCDYCLDPDRVKRAIESATCAKDHGFYLGKNELKGTKPVSFKHEVEDEGSKKQLRANGLLICRPEYDSGCDFAYSDMKPTANFQTASSILSKYEGLEVKNSTGLRKYKQAFTSKKENNVEYLPESGNNVIQIPKHLIPAKTSVNNTAPKEKSKAKTSADYATDIDLLRQEIETIKKAAEDSKNRLKSEASPSNELVSGTKRTPLASPPVNHTAKHRKVVE